MRLLHLRPALPPLARRSRVAGLVLTLVLAAVPAEAQQGPGVRAGVSADPSQFYFGGHYWSAPLVDQLRFQPNLEVGVGSDRTLVAANIEFAWRFPVPRSPWSVYLGGGPAMNIYSYDQGRAPRGRDDTEVRGGLNFLVGLTSREGVFFEVKVGAIDSPGFKFGVGYTF